MQYGQIDVSGHAINDDDDDDDDEAAPDTVWAPKSPTRTLSKTASAATVPSLFLSTVGVKNL